MTCTGCGLAHCASTLCGGTAALACEVRPLLSGSHPGTKAVLAPSQWLPQGTHGRWRPSSVSHSGVPDGVASSLCSLRVCPEENRGAGRTRACPGLGPTHRVPSSGLGSTPAGGLHLLENSPNLWGLPVRCPQEQTGCWVTGTGHLPPPVPPHHFYQRGSHCGHHLGSA